MRWIDPPPLHTPLPLPDLHPLVAQVLCRHGVATPQAARAFLDPEAYSPSPATELPGLSAAADRVETAIRSRESICIWGDFDVDGQTSTAILLQTLHSLGANVTYHIPVRESESHGVNLPYLQEIIESGAKLILTCDTGITAHKAAEYAHSRGIDMVITDHHELPETLPQAVAITDPKLLTSDHPLSTLSGSGVAYKLAEELYARFGCTDETSQYLDLAALGLVADLAVLTGDARYLVQRGLEILRKTKRLGLQVMMEMAELIPANLTEEHIGFTLGPRLNALGRLGDANPAVELFTTSDPARARVLAMQLEGLNAQRQLLCSQVTHAAEAQLRADPSLLALPVLVLEHPTWPGGVVGIVASRLVERYHKPAILFSAPPDAPARGSARSVERLDITAAIAAQKDMLLDFGGHPMAAGLSLETGKIPEFRVRLGKTVENMLGKTEEEATLQIDSFLGLSEVTLGLAEALESLAPYGPGNDKPVLVTPGLRLQSATTIGRNREHRKLSVTNDAGDSQIVLWWNSEDKNLPEGHFDLAYTVRASDWRGMHQAQMEFVDFRSAEEKPIEIKTRVEIVDYRNARDPLSQLAILQSQSKTLIWAEGREKKEVEGKDRNELEPARVLTIWTTPPSPETLRAALDIVQPEVVYLFAATDPIETPESFLSRLAGLVKYVINQRGGKTTWAELEAATAQRTAAVHVGLGWLAAQGEISLKTENREELTVMIGTTAKDPVSASRLWADIQSLLAETAAYRSFFRQAEKDTLLP